MAGSKADYFEGVLLNHVFNAAAWPTFPASLYLALSSAGYSETATGLAMSELSTGGYARLAVTRNTTNFPTATGTAPTTVSNGAALTFATASGDQGTAVSWYLCDALSGGNILYGADLNTPRTILSGDTVTFAIGQLIVTED
jgi:hypothetical protein